MLSRKQYAASRQQSVWHQSKPLLASLHDWLVEKSSTLSKKSRLGEAFAYSPERCATTVMMALQSPDNNTAERALRAICPVKNFMFFGSDHGGERGALLYGLIGTCRLTRIDPEAYLRHILSVLPELRIPVTFKAVFLSFSSRIT